MKKNLIILCALSLAALATACGSGQGAKNNQAETQSETAIETTTLEVDALLTQASALTDQEVVVEGICTHICQHGGRKLFLMGSSDKQTIQVLAGDQIGAFTPECVNSMVRVKGTMKEDRIDEAYLKNWEMKVKEQTAEQHGDGKAGCESEMKARGEKQVASVAERIAAMRQRIAERKANEGKEYLSFYHIDGASYEILK